MISISFVVGWVVATLFVAVSVAGIVFGLRARRSNSWDDVWGFIFFPAVLLLLCTAVITAWGMYPYDMQYHRYTHVTGTVDRVEARMLADGDATSQQYAIRYQGTGETYRCDDSRCSLLKQGDRLELWCIREWQYASTSGWVCRFDKTTPRVAA